MKLENFLENIIRKKQNFVLFEKDYVPLDEDNSNLFYVESRCSKYDFNNSIDLYKIEKYDENFLWLILLFIDNGALNLKVQMFLYNAKVTIFNSKKSPYAVFLLGTEDKIIYRPPIGEDVIFELETFKEKIVKLIPWLK